MQPHMKKTISTTAGRGLFYTRDSGGKHEMTPAQYLRWANCRAVELGVTFFANEETIAQMAANHQSICGDVYLDYDVCGNLLSRPGLDALKIRLERDRSVTHIFIPRRDRLARPDDPIDGVSIEASFRKSGRAIVFMDKLLLPVAVGARFDISDTILSVIDYEKAGHYRRELAEKIILAQISLAQQGFTTGGRPVFAFRRWLVKQVGSPVRELTEGERVRMAGHHVVWLPVPEDHPDMLLTMRIRELLKTTPASRIVRMLTEEKIPSPDAGRKRRDNGIEHYVSGVWNQATINKIGRNALLAAIGSYGQRSMGDQLRFTPEGPRTLNEQDFRNNGKPKVVRNDASAIKHAPAHFLPIVPIDEHNQLQVVLDSRSTTQRGKPRSRTPETNPLGTSIFDMHCGWPMYRAPYNGSFRYCCGLYTQSHGGKCDHNHVDGPKAARLVLNCMLQKVLSPNGMAKIKRRLEAMASAEHKKPQVDPIENDRRELSRLRDQQLVVKRNLALADTPKQRDAVASIFEENEKLIAELEQRVARNKIIEKEINVQTEVELAMAAIDRLPELLSNAENMTAVSNAVVATKARMYFRFEKQQLKKRIVNKISGGIVTFGDVEPPIELYKGPTSRRALQSNAAASFVAGLEGEKLNAPGQVLSGQEEKSLGNVSRVLSPPIELFLAGVATWDSHVGRLLLAA